MFCFFVWPVIVIDIYPHSQGTRTHCQLSNQVWPPDLYVTSLDQHRLLGTVLTKFQQGGILVTDIMNNDRYKRLLRFDDTQSIKPDNPIHLVTAYELPTFSMELF